jgi:hypothetical protein
MDLVFSAKSKRSLPTNSDYLRDITIVLFVRDNKPVEELIDEHCTP